MLRSCALTLAAGVLLARIARIWLPIDTGYALRTALLTASIMGLAFTRVGAHHPFAHFGAANTVTLVRAMLTSLLAGLVGAPVTIEVAWAAAACAGVVALLDGLDGWLARRTQRASGFGARFDTEVDALLILVLSVLVWRHGKAGAWVLLCGAMRYAFVAAALLLPWMARPLQPTLRGRAVAVLQMIALSLAMAPSIRPPLSGFIAAASLASLTWSFATDIRRLWTLGVTPLETSHGRDRS